jgi:hypothetical protein
MILVTLSTSSVVGQTPPPELRTITLYSSLKYQLTNMPPLQSARLTGDHIRSYLDLSTGRSVVSRGFAVDDPYLSYGTAYLGKDLDWFGVGGPVEERSVIVDLGRKEWNDKLKIPIVAPLPELKPEKTRRPLILWRQTS